MTEQESLPVSKVEIPSDIMKKIEEEVEKDLAPIEEIYGSDPELPEDVAEQTIEFYREVSLDERETAYRFYSWVNATYKPDKVLYPASGRDIMPKLAFGKETVTHTSLEEYISKGPEGKKKYLEDLGEGEKVIADNIELPFADTSFQAVILTGSAYEDVGINPQEIFRVLDDKGIIIFNRSKHTEDTGEQRQEKQDKRISEFEKLDSLTSIAVPEELQSSGASEIEFILLQKD